MVCAESPGKHIYLSFTTLTDLNRAHLRASLTGSFAYSFDSAPFTLTLICLSECAQNQFVSPLSHPLSRHEWRKGASNIPRSTSNFSIRTIMHLFKASAQMWQRRRESSHLPSPAVPAPGMAQWDTSFAQGLATRKRKECSNGNQCLISWAFHVLRVHDGYALTLSAWPCRKRNNAESLATCSFPRQSCEITERSLKGSLLIQLNSTGAGLCCARASAPVTRPKLSLRHTKPCPLFCDLSLMDLLYPQRLAFTNKSEDWHDF